MRFIGKFSRPYTTSHIMDQRSNVPIPYAESCTLESLLLLLMAKRLIAHVVHAGLKQTIHAPVVWSSETI